MAEKQNTTQQVQPEPDFDYAALIEQEGEYFDISPEESGYDKEAYIERKRQEKEAVFALANETADRVCSDPQQFQAYLDVQARFLEKSANNGLLIYAQRPDAKLYYSAKDWKKRGRYPARDEKSFLVLERGGQYIRDDGGTGRNINAVHVFDFAQTKGSPLRERTGRIIPEGKELFRAMLASKPVAVQLRPPEELNGQSSLYVSKDAKIYLAQGLEPDRMLRSLAEEYAHAYLDGGDGLYSREQYDLTAQCAAYLFCRRYRLSTEEFDFSRVAEGYGALAAREKCTELDTVRRIALTEEKGVTKNVTPEKTSQYAR